MTTATMASVRASGHTFRVGGDWYLLLARSEWDDKARQRPQPPYERVSVSGLAWILREACANPNTRSALMRLASSSPSASTLRPFGAPADNLLRTFTGLLDELTGPLVLLRHKRPAFTPPEIVAVEEPPGPPEEEELTWIQIEVVDEDDAPVSGVAIRLTTSDHSVQNASTSREGVVYAHGLKPGNVTVEFPGVDAADWEPA